MPQIPNAPGTRYAFRTCVDRKATELITEMQQSGWTLDSWAPMELRDRGRYHQGAPPEGGDNEAMMLLAFTGHEGRTLMDVTALRAYVQTLHDRHDGPGHKTGRDACAGILHFIDRYTKGPDGAGEPDLAAFQHHDQAPPEVQLYACVPPHGWDTAMEELCGDWEARNEQNRTKPSRTDAYRDGFHDGAIWGAETQMVVRHAVHELKRLSQGAKDSANLTLDGSDQRSRDNRLIAEGHVTAYDQALELLGVKPGG